MLQLSWRIDPVHAHHGDRQPRPPHPRPRHRRLPHLLLQQRLRTGLPKNKLHYYFTSNNKSYPLLFCQSVPFILSEVTARGCCDKILPEVTIAFEGFAAVAIFL